MSKLRSDRYGRRVAVLPFVALSPVATLLLILGPRDLSVIAASRALAGLCSGVVFGSATAWVQELSHGAGARRTALALSAGFGLGPVVAAMLAQWAPDPLRVPYLPHLAIGVTAALLIVRVPEAGRVPAGRVPEAGLTTADAVSSRRWPPAPVLTPRFWLAIAPAAPLVFGSVSVAIVVLPADVTSARTLSAGFAGLITALAFAGGLGIQPLARRVAAEHGVVAALSSVAVGTGIGVVAVHDQSRVLAGLAAVFLGLGYGACLVSGLRQAEALAGPADRGAVVACYYALAYAGFAAPYLAAALGGAVGEPGALAVMAAAVAVLAAWTAACTRFGG